MPNKRFNIRGVTKAGISFDLPFTCDQEDVTKAQFAIEMRHAMLHDYIVLGNLSIQPNEIAISVIEEATK